MTTLPFVSGFGAYAPPKVLTNHHLEQLVDTSSEWIITRTGIEQRRIVEPGVAGTDLALQASLQALKQAGRQPEDITHIFYATCTPDAQCPPSSCILSNKLGIKGQVCMDINAACTGFISVLDMAKAYVLASPAACILLVAAETLSRRCNWQDRTTCVLFGDGAGAVVITGKAPEKATMPTARLVDCLLASDGSLGDLLVIGNPQADAPYALGDTIGLDYFITMQGRDVFKHAVRNMAGISLELLRRNNLTVEDIDVLMPHQANLRIIEAVGSRLQLKRTRTFVNVHKYGNTSAASIPLALEEALTTGFISRGEKVLLASFGGGFTWGAALLQF